MIFAARGQTRFAARDTKPETKRAAFSGGTWILFYRALLRCQPHRDQDRTGVSAYFRVIPWACLDQGRDRLGDLQRARNDQPPRSDSRRVTKTWNHCSTQRFQIHIPRRTRRSIGTNDVRVAIAMRESDAAKSQKRAEDPILCVLTLRRCGHSRPTLARESRHIVAFLLPDTISRAAVPPHSFSHFVCHQPVADKLSGERAGILKTKIRGSRVARSADASADRDVKESGHDSHWLE